MNKIIIIIKKLINKFKEFLNRKTIKQDNNHQELNSTNNQNYTYYPNYPIYYPFKKKYILTKNEYKFYNQLREITDKMEYIVLTKIRLADIIEVDKSKINKNEYYRYFNQIQSKHIDFLICDNKLNILMAIELDDSSHENEKNRKSDILKNNALSTAGITLIRCRDIAKIRQMFNIPREASAENKPI